MSQWMKWWLLVGLGWLLAVPTWASVPPQDLPPRPRPARLLNDLAGVLTPAQQQALETKLRRYADTTSTQVAVVLLRSTGAYELTDYAQQLGQAWGVGQQGRDNGLVVLLAVDQHQVTIQTGYGMEGSITDALTGRIIYQQFQPAFRQGRYYEGLDAGLDVLFRAAGGEFKAAPKPVSWGAVVLLLVLVLVGLGFFAVIGWVVFKAVRAAREAQALGSAQQRPAATPAYDWDAFEARMEANRAHMAGVQASLAAQSAAMAESWQHLAEWAKQRPATATATPSPSATDPAAPATEAGSAAWSEPVAPGSTAWPETSWPTNSAADAPSFPVPEPSAADYSPPALPDPPAPSSPDFDGFGGGRFGGGGSSGSW